MLLALVQLGVWQAGLVALGYLVINFVIAYLLALLASYIHQLI